MGQAYSVRLSSVKTDADWLPCSESCFDFLPLQVYGHIYQNWEGGEHWQGVLDQWPGKPCVYTGYLSGGTGDSPKMQVTFCYSFYELVDSELIFHDNVITFNCFDVDWCEGMGNWVENWYCMPYGYVVGQTGDLTFRCHPL